MSDKNRLRKYTFEIILDLDIVETYNDTMNDCVTVGMDAAFIKLGKMVYKGISDSSMDLHEENGGFVKYKDEGFQLKWEIDYPNEVDWIDHEEVNE